MEYKPYMHQRRSIRLSGFDYSQPGGYFVTIMTQGRKCLFGEIRKYIKGVEQSSWPAFGGKLWQRNYYEHIIRDQSDYEHIANYIAVNPLKWEGDEENQTAARSMQFLVNQI